MRLIDADKLLENFSQYDDTDEFKNEYEYGLQQRLETCIRAVEEATSVDAVPVVRCAVCIHFKCNMRGDGTLPKGVDEFECRNGRGGCDPMGFCDEGEWKVGRAVLERDYNG